MAEKKIEIEQRYYRRRQLIEMLGVSSATLYRWMHAGTFPRPVQLGEHSVAWPASAIAKWQNGARDWGANA